MRPSLLLLLAGASAYRTGRTKIQRREPWVVAERFCFEGRSTLDYAIKTTGGTRMFIYGSNRRVERGLARGAHRRDGRAAGR